MSIKGFVAFYGDSKNNLITPHLCDYFRLNICNGVSFFGEGYTVISSSDYISSKESESLQIEIGKNNSGKEELLTKISFNNDSLNIVRDRWGVRTVYYCTVKNGICISSDIRFLLSLPVSDIDDYDVNSLLESATFGYIYSSNRTLFTNIKQLPRNSILVYKMGVLKIDRKQICCLKSRYNCLQDAVEDFVFAFESAVKNAQNINGKKAFLLSGGMDSTALCLAAAKKQHGIDTVSFASPCNTDDIYYAEKIAKHINSNHLTIFFQDNIAITKFPFYINSIENVEFDGIFSPLGGYAYYLLCEQLKNNGFEIVFPGEGADEILGGYYWQLTHVFGFVDRLKEKAEGTYLYDNVTNLFPDVEESNFYRKIAYYMLQGTALTNYHLNCVEHTAKAFGLFNYPIYMTNAINKVIKDVPLRWLCDGKITKILLREYLYQQLSHIGLSNLITRRKLAMPSVVTSTFMDRMKVLAVNESNKSNNPYKKQLKGNQINILMLDVFHKYFTTRPLKAVNEEEWREDLERITKNESIIHW